VAAILIDAEDQVAAFLRRYVRRLTLLVEGAHLLLGGSRLCSKLAGLDQKVADFYLFVLKAEFRFHFGRGDDDAFDGQRKKFRCERLFFDGRLKFGDGHALLGEECSVDILAYELAVLKQLRDERSDGFGEFGFGEIEPHALGLIGEGAFGDHLLNEHRDIDGFHATLDTVAAEFAVENAADVGDGQRLVADLGDNLGIRGSAADKAAVARNKGDDHGQGDKAK